MRITNTVQNVKLLAVVSTPSKDGKSEYHKLSILLNNEAGMISCNEEIADMFKKNLFNPLDEADVVCEYNDQYGSYKAIRVLLKKSK